MLEFHNNTLVKKLLLKIFESDHNLFNKAIRQINKLKEDQTFEIVQPLLGYASILTPKGYFIGIPQIEESYSLKGISLFSQKGNLTEVIIYMMNDYAVGISIKEDISNYDIDKLDISNMKKEEIFQNRFYVNSIDLEGMFDDYEELHPFIDDENLAEEYLIDGQILYRFIQYEETKCFCINDKNEVFKVNLQNASLRKISKSIKAFNELIKKDSKYLYKIIGR